MTSGFGGKYAETTLTPGKKHLLRLVNTGINNWVHVGLDGHPFTVIAADFTPIVPYTATSVSIAVGKSHIQAFRDFLFRSKTYA
jgi:FtsP/CotA-like multicopper oxidase with cupredoxin domain